MQHDPEGLADDAVVDVLLGKPADPEIEPVDPLHDTGPIGLHGDGDVAVDRPEGRDVRGGEDEVRVGLPELRDHRVAEAVARLEVLPGGVGREVAAGEAHRVPDVGIGGGRQIGPDLVEGAEAHIPAAGHVEGEQVGPNAHEVVANRIDDVEVDVLGRLLDGAADDAADAVLGVAGLRHVAGGQRRGEHRGIVARVEEGVEQADRNGLAVGALHIQRLPDQGVAEPEHRRRELVADRDIHARIIGLEAVRAVRAQTADQRLQVLVEDDTLILRLVDHLGGLEHLLGRALEAGFQQLLDVVVVVARPDRVDRGEGEVLVGPPVAGHKVVEDADEGVGVEQQWMARAHEVSDELREHLRVEGAGLGVEQGAGHPLGQGEVRVIGPEADRPVRSGEDGVGLPVVVDQLAQRRQQVEGGVGRVRCARQEPHADALRPVALSQELADQRVGAVGLVLVDVGGGLVLVLRHAVRIDGHDGAAGEVGRVVGARCPAAGRTDHDRAVATLRQEVEPVVDVLAHRHEEDVGVVSSLGQAGLLRAEDVADGARVEAVEDRVDGPVAVGVGLAVAGLGQADEGLVGAAPGRVVEVVTVAAELAVARRHVVVARIVRALAAHQRLQPVDVGCRVGEGAGDALAVPSVGACIDRDPRHATRGREGDGMRPVGEGRHAVGARGRDVVRPVRAGRQFDHVLRPQGADDGVVPPVRAEDDAVGRGEGGHVHGVVAR